MSQRTYVLDTNVLLYDPDAVKKFEGHDVVIPLVVLEELDKMKRLTSELGKNARHVIRFLGALKGDLFQGVDLPNDQALSIYVDNKGVDREGFPLNLDQNKHRILFTAYKLKRQGKEVVVLLSKDFILRIKAESIGVKTQDYDNIKETYPQLYRGWRQLALPKPEIDTLAVRGSLTVPDIKLFPNEYCHLECPEQSTVLGKYNPKVRAIEPISPSSEGIWGISPLNVEQQCAFDLLLRDDIQLVTLIGQAGTGKTLLALVCGLRKVFDEEIYNRIVISRPIMPLGKDIGYLPGTKEEKMYHWMQPIYDNLEFICETHTGKENGRTSKQWFVESDKIEMEAVTFIRGRSFAHTYIIIDEAQNLTPHEIKAIISRAGKGTKVVLTGDPTQIDNPYLDKNSNALTYVVEKFKPYGLYGHIFFEKTERSPLAALAAEVL
ncbi:MAG: PhoH family protein [Chlamydiota bacterium]